MNKIYFAGPIIAMLLFTGIFLSAQSGVKERHAAAEKQARIERENKIKTETEARRKAVIDALAAQEIRQKERAEKEVREIREKEEREAAVTLRDKTYRDQDKLARQVDRLKKDIETEKAAMAKTQEGMGLLETEHAFLKDFVQKARGNVKTLETLITQIATAESARAAAAAAAASAAAKKTS